METNLQYSYKICAQITKSKAKNFYYAFLTLPATKRRAIYAVYAFCRYCDDISDDFKTEDKYQRFIDLKNEINESIGGTFSSNPIMPALIDTIHRFEIPNNYFFELIEGVEMDLSKSRFQDFNELKEYCYKVASIVGLISINIFGYKHSKAKEYAIDLGMAMQLTNILRDLREDAERDRIYLPQDELNQFGYTENDMINTVINNNFHELMVFQVKRARAYFDSGIMLLNLLHHDAQGCTAILHQLYSRILDRIENRKYDVFASRVSLSVIEKLSIMAKFFLISLISKTYKTNRK